MTKSEQTKPNLKKTPAGGGAVETYLAPPPPSNGKVVGIDCHPDTFTAAVFVGQTPHDARKIESRENLSLDALLQWASAQLSAKDIILMEAGSNSFELCKRLGALGLRAFVLESCHVGKHVKTYADNDKMAAARIALVYLAGNAPCVWVPDDKTLERRQLFHAYRNAVKEETAATNSLKGFLNQHGIRLGKHSPKDKKTPEWVASQKPFSDLNKQLLDTHWKRIAQAQERRKLLYRLICDEMTGDPFMMRCMKLLGIGIVSAFGLLAIIGDIHRFDTPAKLVAYIGLNPGQRQSGTSKYIRLGVGHRGRGDIRGILTQCAQAVLRRGMNTPLGKWGWQLFARKGNRNVAVAAIARKLVVQVWHLLRGNPPVSLESDGGLRLKLAKLVSHLGKALRQKHALGNSITEAITTLVARCNNQQSAASTPNPIPA